MYNQIKTKLKNPLLIKIFVYTFSDGISKAFPFLLFPIIAFYLNKEEFGLVTNYNVLISIIGPFIAMSSAAFLSVEYYNNKNQKKIYTNILYLALFLFLVTSSILFSFRTYIQNWIGLSFKYIVLALISSIFALLLDLYLTKLRLDEKAKIFGIFNIVNSIIGAAITILFVVVLKWGLDGRIYSLFILTILSGIVSLIYTLKYIGNFTKPDLKIMKNILTFGIPLLPHQISVWIKTGFEKFFITASLGLAQNGVYSFAVTISSIFVIISNAFFSAFSPYVFKTLSNIKNDDESNDVKLAVVRKSYIFLVVYFFILVLGGLICTAFVKFLFNEKYGTSIIYLPFLLGFNFFNSCYIVLSMFIYYSKTTKYLGLITISTSILQVLLMVYLVNILGSLGAAFTSFLVSFITMVIVYMYSNNVYKMPWFNFADIFGKRIITNKI